MVRHIPRFDSGDVHVWLARTTDLPSRSMRRLAGVMAADERARLARFAAELHRRQYAIGRGLLRLLIGAYLKCEPQFVRFAYGPTGKPQLAGEALDRLRFSVAHSGEVVALAFARSADIGIDVERIVVSHDWLDVARQTCTRRELDDVMQLPPAGRAQRFFSIWTRRESFVKATGQGIGALTRDLEIPSTRDGWHVVPVDVGPGYAAAVAVHAPGINLTNFTWTDESDDAGFREYTIANGTDCR